MNLRVFFSVIALLLCIKLSAQQPDMDRWIYDGGIAQTAQRLISLGVDKDAAEALVHPNYEYAKWNSLRTQSQQKFAILFLPCTLDSAYLYLLTNDESAWHVVDKVRLDCHYDLNVSIEITPVRKTALDEVIVHHACDGHGTGFLQQNFKVLGVMKGKFKIFLDTEELLNVYRGGDTPYDLKERSTFIAVPMRGSSSRVIEETRSKTINGRFIVERRQFRFNASSARYLPSKFMKIEASSE